ncbi:phosphoenolpyruvate hydrolase family protein [Lysinibacillus sp. BPa_S21]|nr:phosphoenolpyruvate hydrolase family protein [Lysinibacillus sp. BPa_S21]MCL1701572.1 phosphoenolpyruvate hydrolase family protein [Lysinibacillus sp. Bpr_S20]
MKWKGKLKQIHKQINENKYILGVAAGAGMTAKYAEQGGADFISSK